MAKSILAVASACILCICSSPAIAQNSNNHASITAEGASRLDRWMQQAVDTGRVSGGVILITRDGETAFLHSYGHSDRSTERMMRSDDIFRIYSMTKPVVSVALLTLYEEGKFQLDDPLELYIPEFANLKVFAGVDAQGEFLLEEPRRKPTVLDAFRHTLGVSAGAGPGPVNRLYVEHGILVNRLPSLARQMELLGELPLLFHPGEQWLYGYGHDVQAHLIERLSGMKLADFLQQRIFGPLQMRDTGYSVPAEKRDRVATLHDVAEAEPPIPAVDMRPSTYERFAQHPMGTLGLWSTAPDYARFAQMLLNSGELEGTRILGRKTVELMATNQLPPSVANIGRNSPGTGYGLGVSVQIDVAADANLSSLGAFGWSGAATTHFIVDPKERMVAVFMAQKAPIDNRILSEFQTMTYQSIK